MSTCEDDIRLTPEMQEPIENEVMCTCSGTTRGQIINLMLDGLDLDAISRKTGALSGCGGCEWDIGEFAKTVASQLMTNGPNT